jgi:transcriptional activator of cad operon
MDDRSAILLRIGAWCVDPVSGQISHAGEVMRVEARSMRLLCYLADRAGEVVSIDDLLNHVWAGVIVTPDSVYQAVASLRRLLKDDAKQPAYIATVPRLGYRLVAAVSPWDGHAAPAASEPRRQRGRRPVAALLAAGTALCLAFAAALLLQSSAVRSHQAAAEELAPRNSVAVLPFLDLTSQAMDQEYFADGMTEELIDTLSKIPNLHVPAPTASFFFKGKRMTIRDMAKSLGVAYVIDGSLRKSDGTLRVAARLVRAEDGFVVWSQTFDRSVDDELKVQDDIAGAVSKALVASIDQVRR